MGKREIRTKIYGRFQRHEDALSFLSFPKPTFSPQVVVCAYLSYTFGTALVRGGGQWAQVSSLEISSCGAIEA